MFSIVTNSVIGHLNTYNVKRPERSKVSPLRIVMLHIIEKDSLQLAVPAFMKEVTRQTILEEATTKWRTLMSTLDRQISAKISTHGSLYIRIGSENICLDHASDIDIDHLINTVDQTCQLIFLIKVDEA